MSKNLLTDFLFLGYFRNCKNLKVIMSYWNLLSMRWKLDWRATFSEYMVIACQNFKDSNILSKIDTFVLPPVSCQVRNRKKFTILLFLSWRGDLIRSLRSHFENFYLNIFSNNHLRPILNSIILCVQTHDVLGTSFFERGWDLKHRRKNLYAAEFYNVNKIYASA